MIKDSKRLLDYKILQKLEPKEIKLYILRPPTFLHLLFLLLDLLRGGAKEGEDDAGLGVDPHRCHEDPAAPLHNMGAGQNHRVSRHALLDLEAVKNVKH